MNAGTIIKERQELLRRVLNSAQFAQAESLRRILQYLADLAERSQEGSDISEGARDRGKRDGAADGVDPKADPPAKSCAAPS